MSDLQPPNVHEIRAIRENKGGSNVCHAFGHHKNNSFISNFARIAQRGTQALLCRTAPIAVLKMKMKIERELPEV
jgi:hypothetical protein